MRRYRLGLHTMLRLEFPSILSTGTLWFTSRWAHSSQTIVGNLHLSFKMLEHPPSRKLSRKIVRFLPQNRCANSAQHMESRYSIASRAELSE